MRMLLPLLIGLATAVPAGQAAADDATLAVEGTRFVLTTATARMTSEDLVGAEFDMVLEGVEATIRIDAVTPAPEQSSVLLHSFSVRDPQTGAWSRGCEPDAQGRRVGFPMAGKWADDGTYIKDPKSWFMTCTSGSNGKCALWGYNPWETGPGGQPLDRLYQACQQMARADYDGKGDPHTRDGTTIDIEDVLDIQTWATGDDPTFVFEAGWGPDGAVCVAATRWPDLAPVEALWKASPQLTGPCDRKSAEARGALMFTRVKAR